MSNEYSDDQFSEDKEAFKQAKVFTQKEEYFGIPSKIFYNVLVLSIGLMIAFMSFYGVCVGIVIFLLLIIPLHQIHKADPFAMSVWAKCLFRQHNRWCAGRSENITINFLNKENF